MRLYENERIDEVNDKLRLIQKPEGLTFGTDALLLAGYIPGKFADGIELGAGSGIISMLLLTREKLSAVTAVEIQEEYAALTRRNAELNGLSDRLHAVNLDIREITPTDKKCALIFTNPPYMKVGDGASNTLTKKNIARHEVHGTIRDFCRAASLHLKYGGTFAVVYRPDRLTELLSAMAAEGLEAKNMTFVHADEASAPSMVLILAKKGGKCGLYLSPPLLIYRDVSHAEYGVDMQYIMENGTFPQKFYPQRKRRAVTDDAKK